MCPAAPPLSRAALPSSPPAPAAVRTVPAGRTLPGQTSVPGASVSGGNGAESWRAGRSTQATTAAGTVHYTISTEVGASTRRAGSDGFDQCGKPTRLLRLPSALVVAWRPPLASGKSPRAF